MCVVGRDGGDSVCVVVGGCCESACVSLVFQVGGVMTDAHGILVASVLLRTLASTHRFTPRRHDEYFFVRLVGLSTPICLL